LPVVRILQIHQILRNVTHVKKFNVLSDVPNDTEMQSKNYFQNDNARASSFATPLSVVTIDECNSSVDYGSVSRNLRPREKLKVPQRFDE